MMLYRLARLTPTSLVRVFFLLLLSHILQTIGFINLPLCHINFKRTSVWRRETCALKVVSPIRNCKDERDASNHKNETGTSFSRAYFLKAVSLTATCASLCSHIRLFRDRRKKVLSLAFSGLEPRLYQWGGNDNGRKQLERLGFALIAGQSKIVRAEDTVAQEESPTVGKITKNGVKYFEYREGQGASPRWGQDCVIRFTMYGRSSPDSKLVKIQSSDDNDKEPYLFKHGNGRQLKGMEEGLHSMRVGGKRRIIFPQQLGYSVQGLGPYPAYPRKRDTLVKVLQSFEKTNRGEFIMDVELLEAFDDEADQGYYEDEAISEEDLEAMLAETRRFSGGLPFEKLPGQLAEPLDN